MIHDDYLYICTWLSSGLEKNFTKFLFRIEIYHVTFTSDVPSTLLLHINAPKAIFHKTIKSEIIVDVCIYKKTYAMSIVLTRVHKVKNAGEYRLGDSTNNHSIFIMFHHVVNKHCMEIWTARHQDNLSR